MIGGPPRSTRTASLFAYATLFRSLAGQLVRRLLLRVVRGITRRTTWKWDDALFRHHTFLWLARMVPALAIQYGIMLVPGVPDRVETLVGNQIGRAHV